MTAIKFLIKRIGFVFLIYALCRILFFIINYSYFNQFSLAPFIFGLRFDYVAISYLFTPFVVFYFVYLFTLKKIFIKICNWFYVIGIVISIVLNGIDFIYFQYTFKRSTADLFSLIFSNNDTFRLIPQFIIDFWYVILIAIGLIYFSIFSIKKISFNLKVYPSKKSALLFFLVTLVFLMVGFRGGIQHKPITIIHAGNNVNPKFSSLVLNTPFTILKTLLEEKIEEKNYFPPALLDKIYKPVVVINNDYENKAIKTRPNIVVIILESIGSEYIGALSKKTSYTPFLDSLIPYCTVYENMYANGQKSIESLPAIFTGIPALMNTPYIISNYAGNKVDGLPKILKKYGYTSSFYHGGANGTMSFDGFAYKAGFDEYKGLNEYPHPEKDYDGNWGIFDEPYLQYFCEELSNTSSPFISCVYTLSSHHPYKIPEKYESVFEKGPLPIHRSVRYADYSLKKFFESAQKKDWYNNTIFFITADHTGQPYFDFYKSRWGQYKIPLIVFEPKYSKNHVLINSSVTQHADITPLILDCVGVNDTIVSFANQPNTSFKYALNFYNNIYQLVSKNYLLQFDGEKVIGFYDIKKDTMLTDNLVNVDKHQKIIHLYEIKLKAIIQQYYTRMIQNKLSYRFEKK